MFELPEYLTIAKQMNKSISGKTMLSGVMGNSPHKFVWYNQNPQTFSRIVNGKTIGNAYCKGRWLFIPLEPGYVLVLGECGGKIILVDSNNVPSKYHLLLNIEGNKSIYAMTQMWGAMELYRKGEELKRQYIADMRTTPLDKEFTYKNFKSLIDEARSEKKRSVKSLLTQDQLIPGLGNSIAQDILFNARLHPKTQIEVLSEEEIMTLYKSIKETVNDAAKNDGRNDEYDFYGNLGKYERVLDSKSIERGCPVCKSKIEKIQYLGGSSYYCSKCQVLKK
jgi:formamidopyrimidine-DNA glycosylase